MERVPVSIVTGALGSGKTTLLNYLLTEHHGIRIGVIVNEFGDVGIDADLIETSQDDIIELPNGCVCCTVRGDLVEAVRKTLESDIEYLLVETSGMAEPGPVANTFLSPDLPEIRNRVKLDGIITVVDAENFSAALAQGHTAEEQIAAADVVLLNKTDIVRSESLDDVERHIKEISPRTYVFRTVRCRAPIDVLLATGKFDIDRWMAEGRSKEGHHEHATFTAVAIVQHQQLRLDATTALLRRIPPDIFRAKGILCVAHLSDPSPEKDLRLVFHKVGKRIETQFDRPWKPGEPHESKLVLIGPKVDREYWQKELDACVVETLHRA
jgi:G3E family GTPase